MSVIASDIDNDGDVDLISASSLDNKILWYENIDGKGAFGPQQIITTNAYMVGNVFASDLNSDGKIDIVSACFGDDKITWHENRFQLNYVTNTNFPDLLPVKLATDIRFIKNTTYHITSFEVIMTNQRKRISSTSGYAVELPLLYCHSLTPCISIYGSGIAEIVIQNIILDGQFANSSIIHTSSSVANSDRKQLVPL